MAETKRPKIPRSPFVFLGGTCNDSDWRERLKKLLKPGVRYFDPVVSDWQPEDRLREDEAKRLCAVELYVITPLQLGVYSIAELIAAAASFSSPHPKVLAVLETDGGTVWALPQRKSMDAVTELFRTYSNTFVFYDLKSLADFLNADLAGDTTTVV